jgi:hypothetical protein
MTNKRVYKYAILEEGNKKYVEVEMAGKAEVYEGENPEDRAKALVVSTQQVPEKVVKMQKVDNLQDSVITSKQTPNK